MIISMTCVLSCFSVFLICIDVLELNWEGKHLSTLSLNVLSLNVTYIQLEIDNPPSSWKIIHPLELGGSKSSQMTYLIIQEARG